ncbi:hypothetical protein [Microbispora sp. NBRC 16548]|uniref:hypothetical protein n=1 Tax=Microbispora sp. NBRC 16548 TaxID=3030994 RepID=UPI0024A52ECD|nr:hypothetical protein [Microbispora sp. NBRC 16548]GLX06811.1 hypothetical protein Misp03_37380 [Microbispora sp. NBRC 16548]
MVEYDYLKSRVRSYAAAHGLTYQQAQQRLRDDTTIYKVRATGQPPVEYVISTEMAAFLSGEGLHGMGPSDRESLNSQLIQLPPVYECGTCGEPGDAHDDATTIRAVIAAYEPDLNPVTWVQDLSRHHARCAPPRLVWKQLIALTSGAQRVCVTGGTHRDIEAACDLTLRPLVMATMFDDQLRSAEPVLLVTAEVVDDHGLGTVYWLNQLEHQWWRPDGFADHPSRGYAANWSIRVEEAGRDGIASPWIAIRYGTDHAGDPLPLCAAALDIPAPWLGLLRGRKELLVLVGPITVAGEAESIPPDLTPRQIGAMLKHGSLVAADAPLIKVA